MGVGSALGLFWVVSLILLIVFIESDALSNIAARDFAFSLAVSVVRNSLLAASGWAVFFKPDLAAWFAWSAMILYFLGVIAFLGKKHGNFRFHYARPTFYVTSGGMALAATVLTLCSPGVTSQVV